MKKQKICIIGGGLSGLVTAISLSKLDLDIDLITGNTNKNIKSNRTIAVSQNNIDYLKKLNVFKSTKKELWPCLKMQLYSAGKNKKFFKIFELDNTNRRKGNILYMLENSKILKILEKKVKDTKSISIRSNKIVSGITNSGLLKSIKFDNKKYKYNLIIICTGKNSSLVKNFFHKDTIGHSYEETSITAILKHKLLKNNTARQIFLDNEILALLPISDDSTSIVWSVKKNLYKKNDQNIKKKIEFYAKNFYKEIKFIKAIEYNDLNFLIRKKYYGNRILLFGDALHVVHPLVGQGFNMVLRDLSSLEKILTNKLSLGLDIGNSDTLSEFSNETKGRNFVYSMGIDLLKNSFSFKEKYIKDIRDNILKNLNKSNVAKKIFFNIADKGLKF